MLKNGGSEVWIGVIGEKYECGFEITILIKELDLVNIIFIIC